MKKVFVFFTMLPMLFFVVSCSKDDDKKKTPSDFSISVAVVKDYNVDVDSLLLAPSQQIHLKATVRNAIGSIIASTPVNWTASSELGSFSQSTAETTVFTVNAGSGDEFYIKAELGGVIKNIPVVVDTLTANFYLDTPLAPIVADGLGSRTIHVTLTRNSNGSEDTNSVITWDVFTTPGSFTQQFTKSGEDLLYIAKANLAGLIRFVVIVNGIVYESSDYTVVIPPI